MMLGNETCEANYEAETLASFDQPELDRVELTRPNGPGNAAERLSVRSSTLRYRMKKLGIRRPASR